jgi:hypothetical protein
MYRFLHPFDNIYEEAQAEKLYIVVKRKYFALFVCLNFYVQG